MTWCDEDVRSELVDGKVLTMSPISRIHQKLVSFLDTILKVYSETLDAGHVFTNPFAMRLGAQAVREPDLLFVLSDNLNRLQETYLDGPADLVIEIISPESIGRDRGEKFVEYENAKIPEYWLIDPIRQQVEFYQLRDGHYHSADISDGIYKTDLLPGFSLHTNWLWQDPLPPTLDILKQLNLL